MNQWQTHRKGKPMEAEPIEQIGKSGRSCLGRRRYPALAALIITTSISAFGQPLQLVSARDASQAPPAGGSGDSGAPLLSPDGRYALFASTANNLVLTCNNTPLPAPFPPKLNVFLRDRTRAATTLVSVNLSGTGGGNGDSLPAALSSDGRYALFESRASDLVPDDANNATDVFVRDLVSGVTLLVSTSTGGGVANGASCNSVMTPDGRCVAFVSAASNLVPGDANGIPDVFVRDLQARATTLVSVGAMCANLPSDSGVFYCGSESPVITSDGRYVAFYSTATNLVPGVTNVGDIYLRDVTGGATAWASAYARTAAQNSLGAADAVCFNHALSDDGQFVAYEARPLPLSSSAAAGLILRYSLQTGLTDLVDVNAAVATAPYEDIRSLDMTSDGRFIAFVANANGTAGEDTSVEVWDAQTSTITLASGDLSGNVAAGSTCDWPVLNPSGQFVAFVSCAPNLVTNVLDREYHLYLRDLPSGTTALADAGRGGVGAGLSMPTCASMSADGRFVGFASFDGNLVPNDRNRADDVFVRDLAAGVTELISAHDTTLPSLSPNGSSLFSTLSVSTDGRFLAFASDADNLVPTDTNGCRDVFLRDLVLGTNILVSLGADGSAADALSTDPAISADGRYVAFASGADNLVTGDGNKALDVFVCDLQSATTILVSVKAAGGGPGNGASYSPLISADGKYVLFRSLASDLAAGTVRGENLFLRNLQSGTTYGLTTLGCAAAAMTRDGRYIAFGGPSGSGGGYGNVYVWDSQAAAKVYTKSTLAVAGLGISPDGNRIVYALSGQLYAVDRAANSTWTVGPVAGGSRLGLRFSGDARLMVYVVPYGPPQIATNQVYLYDLQAKTNLLVSRSYTSGEPAYGTSDSPDISGDGRFVAYRSAAVNLVPGDTNGLPDVFLYDRSSGITSLLSANRFCNAGADNRSMPLGFSADGQTVAFQSWGSDLVGQDFNDGSDVFVYRLHGSGQIPLFSAAIVRGASTGHRPWILWSVVPGKAYRVQFKNGPSDAAWQDISGSVTILGNQACFDDLTAGATPRLYRVVAY
jgi:Tol biopolymer transport system component